MRTRILLVLKQAQLDIRILFPDVLKKEPELDETDLDPVSILK